MEDVAETVWSPERVLAASMDAMAIVDGERYLEVNRPYADLYGFSRPDDLAGESVTARLAEAERTRFDREILPACRADGRWRGRVTGRRRDGSTFTQELSIARLADEQFACATRATADDERVTAEAHDRSTRERELERYESIVETVDDGVYALDEEFRFSFVNESLCEMTERTREELVGTPVTELFEYDDEIAAAEEIRQRVVENDTSIGTVQGTLSTSEGERVLEARYRLYPEPDGEYRGSVGVVRDVTERAERERRLERRHNELETLNRINELLLEVVRDLFASPTRNGIEQTVCDRLAASDLYQFAWIGEPDAVGQRIVPRVSAGIDDGYVESITVATTETENGRGPGGQAFRTGDVQVSQDVRTDPSFEPWREQALDRGVKSVVAVPLVDGDTTYGVLAVYASRPLAFSRREQAGFEILGRTVGFAIDAIENRRLLFADAVVELEFEVADTGLVFVRASESLECELTVTGHVESPDGTWSTYLAVDGASPTAVRDLAADDPDVDRVRVVADEDAGGLLEFVTDGRVLNGLTEHGAVLTAGRVEDGQGRFSVEAHRATDVRRLVARLRDAYPDSTLIAQREFDRPVRRAVEVRQSLEDRLTDRQREAIVRAYRDGYFDWPRRSTAGDVAASMDIAETTFHYHLRNALDELLAAFTGPGER